MTSTRKDHSILFVHNDNPRDPLSSFIAHDLETLRTAYSVETVSLYPYKHGHLDVLFSPAVWNLLRKCDAVFGWFGSSAPIVFMAAMLGKPVVLIAGGTDIVYVPEIDYGLNPSKRISYCTYLLGYRLASRILLFSEASRRDYLRLPFASREKSQTLYLGVDTGHFTPEGKKKDQILTVSYINRNSLMRKGIHTFIEAARRTPSISYRIAGLIQEHNVYAELRKSAPPNVSFLGYLDDAQLLRELRDAKVYAQLSFHEGFGLAVAEAMACECVPVVTDRGSLPEVVGNTGYYVPVDDAAATVEAFERAMAEPIGLGQQARKRIIDQFNPEIRKQAIQQIMKEALSA